jgi:hypothetical protein
VLRSIGGYHSFSAGIVIGGKNLKDERDRLSRMNILVATPGRLLQHMDQTVGFDCDNLQMLGAHYVTYHYNSITAVQYSTKLIAFLTWVSRVRFLRFLVTSRNHDRPSFSPLLRHNPSPISPDFPCRTLYSSAQTLQLRRKEAHT